MINEKKYGPRVEKKKLLKEIVPNPTTIFNIHGYLLYLFARL